MMSDVDGRIADLERLAEEQRYLEIVDLAPPLLAEESRGRKAFGHFYLGQAFHHLIRPDDAIFHLRQARELFGSFDAPELEAESLDWEACALYVKEDSRALAMAEDALSRYRLVEVREPAVEARMLEHLAAILTRRRDHNRARACYEEALRVAGRVLDIVRLARIYHGLGACHIGLGDVRRASDLLSRAVELYDVGHDLRPALTAQLLLRAENDLGVVLLRQGELERAEELLRSSLRRCDGSGIDRVKSHVLLSLAELRQLQGRGDEALDIIDEAIGLAVRLSENIALAAAHQQRGQLHADRGDDELADEAFGRALEILSREGLDESREQCLAAHRRVRAARSRASG
jgi:tetratricopeptide (TPR) repeat protein